MKRGDDSDIHTRHILLRCSDRAMSVKELSDTCGIPIGTCYKIVRRLISKGVLRCSLNVSNQRVVPLFRSRLDQDSQAMKKHIKGIA